MSTKPILSQKFLTSYVLNQDGKNIPRRKALKVLVGLAAMAVCPPQLMGLSKILRVQRTCPDPERTAVIDEWTVRVDRAIVALDRWRDGLVEARRLPPDEIHGPHFIELGYKVLDQLDELIRNFEGVSFDALVGAISGKPPLAAYILKYAEWGEDPDRLQLEIGAISSENLQDTTKLIVMLPTEEGQR
jgi:hypothetical protein